MVDNKKEVPLIYLYIFSKMLERFGRGDTIVLAKNLIEVSRRTVHQIPKRYDYFILKEMTQFGLLEKINTQKFILKGVGNEKILIKLQEYFLW